jgi:glutathione-independent formaldehyde dehydrogenase
VKAVVYEGPRQVSVKDVPDARMERPKDVLVRITSAKNLGQVVEVGDGVDKGCVRAVFRPGG